MRSASHPITVAVITIIVGGLFIRESRHTKIWDEVGGQRAAEEELTEPADVAEPAAT